MNRFASCTRDGGIFVSIGADPDVSGRLRARLHLPASQVSIELPQQRRHVALDAPVNLRHGADRHVETCGRALEEPRLLVVGVGDVVLDGPQHPDERCQRVDMDARDVPGDQDVAARRAVEPSKASQRPGAGERGGDGLDIVPREHAADESREARTPTLQWQAQRLAERIAEVRVGVPVGHDVPQADDVRNAAGIERARRLIECPADPTEVLHQLFR